VFKEVCFCTESASGQTAKLLSGNIFKNMKKEAINRVKEANKSKQAVEG